MPRTKTYKKKYKDEALTLTVLQYDILIQYKGKHSFILCTRCGENKITSDQLNTYYKGVKVRIMLCATCVPVMVQRLIDVAIEGHDRENLIDSLTKFGQI